MVMALRTTVTLNFNLMPHIYLLMCTKFIVEDDDDDNDGIPDGEEDDDGDGIENDEDNDDDGDGIEDKYDKSVEL